MLSSIHVIGDKDDATLSEACEDEGEGDEGEGEGDGDGEVEFTLRLRVTSGLASLLISGLE